MAKTQQLVKETQTAYSSKALELENLKATNQDLEKVIKDDKQTIFALSNFAIRLKEQNINIEHAKVRIVDQSGSQPASIPSYCESSLSDIRTRVDFEQTKDNLKVSGYTLSNPGFANVKLDWLEDLKLQLVLTKDDKGGYKVYIDSKNAQFVPVALSLSVDPTAFRTKWYERIAFGVDVGASQMGLLGSIKAMYGIKYNLYLGPQVSLAGLFEGKLAPFYGASVLWMPFYNNNNF